MCAEAIMVTGEVFRLGWSVIRRGGRRRYCAMGGEHALRRANRRLIRRSCGWRLNGLLKSFVDRASGNFSVGCRRAESGAAFG